MRPIIVVVLAVLPLTAGFASAAGAADAGETHYATCITCHGADAAGNQALSAPRLNHLEPVYIVAQLEKFKSGTRGGEGASDAAVQMAAMAATLPDRDAMVDVAAYIVTLQAPASAVTVEGDAVMGGDYFNQFCGACHGAGAEGNPALNSPRLAGSDDWYLLAQLQAFRTGVRGTQADDRTGRQMRAMAGVLPSDQALQDVVAFIRGSSQ